jgi:hypothetical protein
MNLEFEFFWKIKNGFFIMNLAMFGKNFQVKPIDSIYMDDLMGGLIMYVGQWPTITHKMSLADGNHYTSNWAHI